VPYWDIRTCFPDARMEQSRDGVNASIQISLGDLINEPNAPAFFVTKMSFKLFSDKR